MKNLAVASALVICAAALRNGAVPGLKGATDAVLDAMSSDTLLDEQLGRLTFVGSFFPEAALVFGEQTEDSAVLTLSGSAVVHGWSEEEPFLAWNEAAGTFASPLTGEVSVVRRDPDGTWSVALETGEACCVFGGMASLAVREGDAVLAGDELGSLAKGGPVSVEVRRDGRSVWPDGWVTVTP